MVSLPYFVYMETNQKVSAICFVLILVLAQVDLQTKRIPIIEVIQVIGGYTQREVAVTTWKRISKDDKYLTNEVGAPRQINGKGQKVYCAKGEIVTQIIWMLPSKLAKQYRMECARIITRFQMGDQTLHSELDHNKASTDANDGLPQFKAVEVEGQGNELVGQFEKRKLALLDIEIQEKRQKATITYTNHAYELLEKLGLLCDRNRMAICDSIMNNLNNGQDSQNLQNPRGQMMLCNKDDQPKQVAEIMEHNLKLSPSMIREFSSGVGKVAADAFRKKYGSNAEFLTANRLIDGAIRKVNMYHPNDIPMISSAIKGYLSKKGVL